MYSVFYRNIYGEQRVINWFGQYSRYIVHGASSAVAMTRSCFGQVDILAVIRWHEPQQAESSASVMLA